MTKRLVGIVYDPPVAWAQQSQERHSHAASGLLRSSVKCLIQIGNKIGRVLKADLQADHFTR